MAKHTPGPWHVGMKPGPIVYGEDGAQVAPLHVPMVPKEENRANARLIAAAPELLEALENLLEHVENRDALGAYWADPMAARAAIAKAKGES